MLELFSNGFCCQFGAAVLVVNTGEVLGQRFYADDGTGAVVAFGIVELPEGKTGYILV